MKKALYNGYKLYLIETVDELKYIRNTLHPKVAVGIDTETTGLDYNSDRIVGICISCGKSYNQADYRGFYLPLRHSNYKNNLPIKDVVEFTQYIIDNYITWWWNRNFDATMLEFEGIVFPCVGKTNDGQCLAHLVKNDPMPALKDFVQDYLHFEVMHYEDNKAEGNSFANTDPQTSFIYAAADPLITTLVSRKLWVEYPYTHKIYPLDNKFAECMRFFMKNAEVYYNADIINKLRDANNRRMSSIRQQIFSMVGYEFRLTSNRDKAEALSRYITLTVKTKKGDFKVDKEVLKDIDHPLAKLLLEYAACEKMRSSYYDKINNFPNPFRVNYQHCNAASGRMSSGGSKLNSFFAPINIQNISKKEVMRYLHRDNSVLRYRVDSNPILCIGGTVTTPNGEVLVSSLKEGDTVVTSKGNKQVVSIEPSNYKATKYNSVVCQPMAYIDGVLTEWKEPTEQGYNLDLGDDTYSVMSNGYSVQIRSLMHMKCKGGLRDAFICPEGYLWLAQDYSSEEMVLLANMSGEPNLIEPLLEGKDIHKYVGIKMFGHYDPTHRTIAKAINFMSNYGAGGPSIAKRVGVSREEGEALLARYNKTMSKVTAWKEEMCKIGKRKGFIFTYFGRPRAVYQYYNSSKPGMKGYADRTCSNSPIQGTGGDIIRIDHVKLRDLYDPTSLKYDKEFADNTKYILTVHDEVDLYVKPHYIKQASEKLSQVMNMMCPGWKVPLKTSPSVGVDWGSQIELKGFNEDGSIIPDSDEDLSLL